MPATAAPRRQTRAPARTVAPRHPRRVSGPVRPVARPRPKPPAAPAPATGAFERLRALPDHRLIDRLLRGRAWVVLIGIALGGIVAMQVSLLKLNSGISRAVQTSSTLERQNSDLEASIARMSSGAAIRDSASARGLVTPPAGDVQYLTARSGVDASRATALMKPPSEAARALMANGGVVPGSLIEPTALAGAPATTTSGPTLTAAVPAATPPAAVAPTAPTAPVAPTPVAPTPAPVTPVTPAPAPAAATPPVVAVPVTPAVPQG